MNFQNMDVANMPPNQYENYIVDTISMLLAARTITKEEARSTPGAAYHVLAHLLERRVPRDTNIDEYIRTVVDDDMDPVGRLRYLVKNILKALPMTAYEVMRPVLRVLWSA